MNYFDLFGSPRGGNLPRSPFYRQKRYLPVNVLHPSREPAEDARLSAHARDVGDMAAARDYPPFRSEQYDPSPGRADWPEAVYLPYAAVLSAPPARPLAPPPSDPDPEETPIKARYIFLTDSAFEQALQESSRDPDETKCLDEVICSHQVVQELLHDRRLEKSIDEIVREDPYNPLHGPGGW